MLTIKYKYQIMPIKKIQMKSVNSKIALMFSFTVSSNYESTRNCKDSVIVPVKKVHPIKDRK
jgi:hypothetical protein